VKFSPSQQGFLPLLVTLSSQGISLLKLLLIDLQTEELNNGVQTRLSPAPLNIAADACALTRVHQIFSSLNVNQFLFNLAFVSYRKVSSRYASMLSPRTRMQID
jgi:hypothetical protein